MKKIAVILGSARSNSNGIGLLNNIKKNKDELEKDNNIELKFMDLRDYNLPIFDGANPPMSDPDRILTGSPKEWLADLKSADGYLILEPVYDNALPGAFKNALDYIAFETKGKPARIVSYSINALGGQAAVFALMPILSMLGVVILPSITLIGKININFEKNGDYFADAPSKDYYANSLREAVKDISSYTKLLNK